MPKSPVALFVREHLHTKSDRRAGSYGEGKTAYLADVKQLAAKEGLASRMPLFNAGMIKSSASTYEVSLHRRFVMFEGKNNRLLDSFSFRFLVSAAVFVAWLAAGYMVLAAT